MEVQCFPSPLIPLCEIWTDKKEHFWDQNLLIKSWISLLLSIEKHRKKQASLGWMLCFLNICRYNYTHTTYVFKYNLQKNITYIKNKFKKNYVFP